jgi:EAL domain-containing protein (putative c-di-GMP-specific phosphodiesterase class I)
MPKQCLSAILVPNSLGNNVSFTNCLTSCPAEISEPVTIGRDHTAFITSGTGSVAAVLSSIQDFEEQEEHKKPVEFIPFLDARNHFQDLSLVVEELSDNPADGQNNLRFWNKSSAHQARPDHATSTNIPSEQKLVFQKILNTENNTCLYQETLTRWLIGGRDLQSIRYLISEASDFHVLETVLEILSSRPSLHLAINLPRERFAGTFVDKAISKISAYDISVRARLLIEIVEVWKSADFIPVEDATKAFCSLGCRIAFDDIGAGIFPKRDLERLRPDFMKLDRLFTERSLETGDESGLLLSFKNLAKDMGAQVIAEGVETKAQSQQLTDMGIELQQGYFHSRETISPE